MDLAVPRRLVFEALRADAESRLPGVKSLSSLQGALREARSLLDHVGCDVKEPPVEVLSSSSYWILVFERSGDDSRQVALAINRFSGRSLLLNPNRHKEESDVKGRVERGIRVGRMDVPVARPALESSTSEILAARLPREYYQLLKVETPEQNNSLSQSRSGDELASEGYWSAVYYLRAPADLSDEELRAAHGAFKAKKQFLPPIYAWSMPDRLGIRVPKEELSRLENPEDPPSMVEFHIDAASGEVTVRPPGGWGFREEHPERPEGAIPD